MASEEEYSDDEEKNTHLSFIIKTQIKHSIFQKGMHVV